MVTAQCHLLQLQAAPGCCWASLPACSWLGGMLILSVLFLAFGALQGVTSWFVFYLIKEKGVADAAQAAVRVSGLELGGLVGSLIAGRLSDMLINKSEGKGGAVGKRVQVCCHGRQRLGKQKAKCISAAERVWVSPLHA
eukprot:GHRR01015187.1.p5 GENE.GHRR01015187.1~~GHRR01015187.1.p5  ORF type:complete len:139 (-),score=46.28 GHRR01015187.1:1915-2331(-)